MPFDLEFNSAENPFPFDLPYSVNDIDSQHFENVPKDTKDIKRAIRLQQFDNGMHLTAVAVSNDAYANKVLEIPAYSGDSLDSEVYDMVRDCYRVRGVDWHEIGEIPINYRLVMEGVSWEVDVPVPMTVAKRYFSDYQNEEFEKWRANYKASQYRIQLVQVVGVY